MMGVVARTMPNRDVLDVLCPMHLRIDARGLIIGACLLYTSDAADEREV